MTRDEFKIIVKTMRGTFSNCLINTEQIFDLWYEMVKDISYSAASENLNMHIRSNIYSPTVAELRGAVDTKDFNNFKRRQYNMDALELELLAAEHNNLKRISVEGDVWHKTQSTATAVQEKLPGDLSKAT